MTRPDSAGSIRERALPDRDVGPAHLPQDNVRRETRHAPREAGIPLSLPVLCVCDPFDHAPGAPTDRFGASGMPGRGCTSLGFSVSLAGFRIFLRRK